MKDRIVKTSEIKGITPGTDCVIVVVLNNGEMFGCQCVRFVGENATCVNISN